MILTTSDPTFGATHMEDAIGTLRRVLLSEATLDGVLDLVLGLGIEVIPACDAVAVTLAERGRVRATAGSDPTVRGLIEQQIAGGEGPCAEATETDGPCRVDVGVDAGPAEAWPAFVAEAAASGFRSIYCVPMRLAPSVVGCLMLGSTGRPFGPEDERLARELGAQARITLGNVLLYERSHALVVDLRSALAEQDLVGQAKGVIMESRRCTSIRAAEILHAAAQAHGLEIHEMAKRIVEEGAWTTAPSS